METVRVQHGATERIYATMLNASGATVTGLTNVLLEVRRKSDGKYFDFDDNTFKTSGWTTRQGVMTELDGTNSAGVYYYDFNTTQHSTVYGEETYFMRVTSSSAANDPLEGELKVGGYVDQIGLFSSGSSTAGLTPQQMKSLAEMVWGVILEGKSTAREVLLRKSEFDAAQDFVMIEEDANLVYKLDVLINKIEKLDNKDLIASLQKSFSTKDISLAIKDISSNLTNLQTKIDENTKKLTESGDQLFTKVSKLIKIIAKQLTTQISEGSQLIKKVASLDVELAKELEKEIRDLRSENKTALKALLDLIDTSGLNEIRVVKDELSGIRTDIATLINSIK